MSHASNESQTAARFASAVRGASRRTLSADTTVRAVVLSPGGWRLYGNTTQVYYCTRKGASASDPTSLASGEIAPTTGYLAAPSAGSPGTGLAFPASGTDPTALAAATLPDDFREIAVKGGD